MKEIRVEILNKINELIYEVGSAIMMAAGQAGITDIAITYEECLNRYEKELLELKEINNILLLCKVTTQMVDALEALMNDVEELVEKNKRWA